MCYLMVHKQIKQTGQNGVNDELAMDLLEQTTNITIHIEIWPNTT